MRKRIRDPRRGGPRRAMLLACALTALIGIKLGFSSEILTQTSFFPSLLGVYQQLLTTGLTILARDEGARVGIGTASPMAKLDVSGTIRFNNDLGWGVGNGRLYAGNPGNFGGKELVLTVADGLGTDNDEIWIGPNTGSYKGHIQLVSNELHINAPKGVQVNGSIAIQDGTQGVGKVLTSDALGTASWKPASGGKIEALSRYFDCTDPSVKFGRFSDACGVAKAGSVCTSVSVAYWCWTGWCPAECSDLVWSAGDGGGCKGSYGGKPIGGFIVRCAWIN